MHVGLRVNARVYWREHPQGEEGGEEGPFVCLGKLREPFCTLKLMLKSLSTACVVFGCGGYSAVPQLHGTFACSICMVFLRIRLR